MKNLRLSALFLLGLLVIVGCSEQQPPAETAPAPIVEAEPEPAAVEPEDNGQLTIVVFGASGSIGGLITQDAIDRGHNVVGISRNPDGLAFEGDNFSAASADLYDVESVKTAVGDADAVIISVDGSGEGNLPENSVHATAAKTMVEAYTGDDSAPHVIQIGGATTMYGSAEEMADKLPFPAAPGSEMHGMLYGHMVALETYWASDIPWTVVTPPFMIQGWTPAGITDTTSKGYRISTEAFLTDEEGKPTPVMVADLAAAAVDQAENREYMQQRIVVGQ